MALCIENPNLAFVQLVIGTVNNAHTKILLPLHFCCCPVYIDVSAKESL